jgi:hypothetical protein
MVEVRERTIEPEEIESSDEIKPKLQLLTEQDDQLLSVEFQKELDILNKFQRDYGLADSGAALTSMAEHSSPEENAARYAEACVSNEVYLSAEDQLEAADPGKKSVLKLLDIKQFANGETSAIQEAEAPFAPQLKAAYDSLNDSGARRESIKAGYGNFFQKATGMNYQAIAGKGNEVLQFIRNIQPAYSPGETAEISRRRAALEKKLNDFTQLHKFFKTSYEGILLPNPSSFNNEVVFDLSGEIKAISAVEYSREITSIADEANLLKSDSDSIIPRVKESRPSREKTEKQKNNQDRDQAKLSFTQFVTQPIREIYSDIKNLFRRKAE